MRFVSNVLGHKVISWEEDMQFLPPVGSFIYHQQYLGKDAGYGRVKRIEYISTHKLWIVHLDTFYKNIPE